MVGKIERYIKPTSSARANNMKDVIKENSISNIKRSKVIQPKSILKYAEPLNKENDEVSFISGENFDFNRPIGTPYKNSPLCGPMTR